MRFPETGSTQSGRISASGTSAKRRALNRGCGRIGSGRFRTLPPRSSTSTSISRGPLRKVGVLPTRLSTRRIAARSAAGVPGHAISTAAFQKSGCRENPTGSVR